MPRLATSTSPIVAVNFNLISPHVAFLSWRDQRRNPRLPIRADPLISAAELIIQYQLSQLLIREFSVLDLPAFSRRPECARDVEPKGFIPVRPVYSVRVVNAAVSSAGNCDNGFKCGSIGKVEGTVFTDVSTSSVLRNEEIEKLHQLGFCFGKATEALNAESSV